MTNKQLEEIMRSMSDSLINSALSIRAMTEAMDGCVALVRADGQIGISTIDVALMRMRVKIISELVRESKAVGFLFVHDGYYTLFDTSKHCSTCGGRGCEICRHTGGVPSAKHEAITVIGRTRWGFALDAKRCYKMVMGVPVPIELTNDVDMAASHVTRVIDPYAEIFGAPLTVH